MFKARCIKDCWYGKKDDVIDFNDVNGEIERFCQHCKRFHKIDNSVFAMYFIRISEPKTDPTTKQIELIQIVRVYHNEDSYKKHYWFEVPKTQEIKTSQMVIADTKKGRKKVTATCDSFFIQKDAISVLGVSELKMIVGILEEREVIWDVE